MKLVVIGTGYVGLVTGACFAEIGVSVVCVDINKEKIDKLKEGIIPIYEPGLSEIVKRNVANCNLDFSTSLSDVITGATVVMIAVGTPQGENGSADLQHVLNVARDIGKYIDDYTVVVTKSTVPIGTSLKIQDVISREISSRGVNIEFNVASNPEFLKEGSAINDFLNPDRIVIGVDSESAKKIMQDLYSPFDKQSKVLFMDIASSEMTKYVANAMLATRISFMNEVANLCEVLGADVDSVRIGIGSDKRIGSKFLYPGVGYGGSCFPKDVKALIRTATENNKRMQILESVESVNVTQKQIVFNKLSNLLSKNLNKCKIAVWGLSFKPNTDDMREASSIILIEQLLKSGAKVAVYDPVAYDTARVELSKLANYGAILFGEDQYDVLQDSDALVIVTEWKEFISPDFNRMKKFMRNHLIIDGRNIYTNEIIEKQGFVYDSIGRVNVSKSNK